MKELSESRVLIVDDAPANVDLLVNALRGEHQLSVALDGAGALRAIEKVPPIPGRLAVWRPGLEGSEAGGRLVASPKTRIIQLMFWVWLENGKNRAKGFEGGGTIIS